MSMKVLCSLCLPEALRQPKAPRRELTDSEMRFAWLPKILNKILDFLPEFLLIVAGFFIGVAGVPAAMSWATSLLDNFVPDLTVDGVQVYSFALGTLITVVNVAVATVRRKSRTALELQLREIRSGRKKDLITLEVVLGRAAVELAHECEVWNAHTRISLYRHGVQAQSFIRLARISLNPQLCNGGREFYPDSEGLIADVWTRGSASVRDLKEDREEWNEQLVKSMGYDLQTARRLTMQSRSLVGIRLDFDGEPVGVVIIESENPRGVSARIIDELRASHWLNRTAMLFAVSRENILSLAHRAKAWKG